MVDPADLVALAGQMILENGGETFRVEETMSIMAIACGADGVDVFATPPGIFCTIRYGEKEVTTRVVRIHRRGFNLAKVGEVNQVSRQLAEGKITSDEAYHQLLELNKVVRRYPLWLHALAGGGASAAFAYLYGAHIGSVIAAGITGLLVMGVVDFFEDRQMYYFITLAAAGAVSAFANILLKMHWPQIEFDLAVIGSIMLLVPGIAITNTMRDALSGDMVSASVRGLEAFGIGLSVAVGVGAVLMLYFQLGGAGI